MRVLFWPFKAVWWLFVRTLKLAGHWVMFPAWFGAVVWLSENYELERPQSAALIFVAVFGSRGCYWIGRQLAPPHLRFSGNVRAAPKEPTPPANQWVSVAVRTTASTPAHRAVVRQLPRELRRLLK